MVTLVFSQMCKICKKKEERKMEANKEGRDLFERALMNGHFG